MLTDFDYTEKCVRVCARTAKPDSAMISSVRTQMFGIRTPSETLQENRRGVCGYPGDLASFFKVFRWKSEGARHTATLVGVIWFSSTQATTSRRKKSRARSASLFSSGSSKMAACAASSCWSLGKSADRTNRSVRRNGNAHLSVLGGRINACSHW